MAYLRLEGEAAHRVWQNVKNDLDLLDAVPLLKAPPGVPGRQFREAELMLITFLANVGFGEEDVLKRRGVPRREYFAALNEINPSTVTDNRLLQGGFVKKGVWYRAHYLHNGSATTLEEMSIPTD